MGVPAPGAAWILREKGEAGGERESLGEKGQESKGLRERFASPSHSPTESSGWAQNKIWANGITDP